MINCRRKAREAALQALYQCDALGNWSEEMIDLYFQQFQDEENEGIASADNSDFSRMVINGVIDNFDQIDAKIAAASKHWSIARMARVDRNILRIAVFEMLVCSDIPASVSINEAIEVAKRFSNDDATNFINGVLDKIASEIRPNERAKPEKTAVND